jgi:hypothetical protein
VPAKFGSSAVKIILVIVAIVVLLGILVLGAVTYVGYRISRAVHVNSANGQVTMSTPGGTFSANSTSTITASDLGTDIYPGAQSAPGGMKMSLPTGSTVTGVYVTSDSKDQVAAFYQSKFGSDASIIETSDSAILSVKKSPEESVNDYREFDRGSGEDENRHPAHEERQGFLEPIRATSKGRLALPGALFPVLPQAARHP